MKYRPILLLVTAVTVVTGYLWSGLSADSMPKAADRFGAAIVKGDTHALWSFVPEDERAFYDFDESKFGAFWTKAIQPELKGIDSFHVDAAGDTGLVVVCESSKKADTSPKFQLLVSGQMGQYYSPYIVGYSCIHAASVKQTSNNLPKARRFKEYAAWILEKQDLLHSLGIRRVRRGPGPVPQTLDQLAEHFLDIASLRESEASVAVASR